MFDLHVTFIRNIITASPNKCLALLAIARTDTENLLKSTPPEVMLATRPVPLLICSIGNPGSQYANTVHSAGHVIIKRLADEMGYPTFHKERSWGNGLVSRIRQSSDDGDWTLWQSTSYMNESGKGVKAAYTAWSKDLAGGEGKLVVIHDELEKPLGAVSLRTAHGASAKGHNGLKSIMAAMGNLSFARIGIGIGRPASRDSDDVARYVLKKMDMNERKVMEDSVEHVIVKLQEVERG